MKLVQWFWRWRFSNFVNVFFDILLLSRLENGWDPSLEQTWIPFTQGCFVPILVIFGSSNMEKIIWNFVSVYLHFINISLANERGSSLNKLEFPLPRDVLFQVWLKLAKWSWRWRWKCEMLATTTTTTTDNGQILIRKPQVSLKGLAP